MEVKKMVKMREVGSGNGRFGGGYGRQKEQRNRAMQGCGINYAKISQVLCKLVQVPLILKNNFKVP